jgi:copper chaperone CopZ
MHIITGLLIAGLLGKNKFRSRSLMPMLRTGPVQTAHFVPGRLRLRVPSLAENGAGAAIVREKLPTIKGVKSVKLDLATGSVLIVYREDEVRPELLFAAVVRLMNLDAELKRTPQPVVTRELREILGSLNRMVYDRTGGLLDLWSAALILLAAIGFQKLLTQGLGAFPAGLTLVWWGLVGLAAGDRQS